MDFASLLGVIPRVARTLQEVTAAGVSVMKELRSKLSTSDQLKLSKSAREGRSDKFSFVETTGLLGSDFESVYDLYMRIDALSKALILYDMTDVFHILLESTVLDLELKLRVIHACKTGESRIELAFISVPIDQSLLSELEFLIRRLLLSLHGNMCHIFYFDITFSIHILYSKNMCTYFYVDFNFFEICDECLYNMGNILRSS